MLHRKALSLCEKCCTVLCPTSKFETAAFHWSNTENRQCLRLQTQRPSNETAASPCSAGWTVVLVYRTDCDRWRVWRSAADVSSQWGRCRHLYIAVYIDIVHTTACRHTHCPLVVILWWWLLLSVVIRKKKLTWRVWWLIICTEVWTGRGLVIKVMFDRHIHFFIKDPLIKQLTFLFSLPKWQNVCSPELCCVIRHTDSCTPH